jgi:replicative DNA helicase
MSVLRQRIKDGLEGKFEGLSMGLPKLESVIFGVQRGVIGLIGAGSGVGKSTLLDYMILKAIEDAETKGITLNVFYNSFEIDKLTKMCNWLSVRIYDKYEIVIPPEVIKGLGKHRLNAAQQELVDSEIDYIESLFKKIHFNFKPENPTGLYKRVWRFMEDRGTFIKEAYVDDSGEEKQKIIGYTANNPDEYNLMVTDHFYLLKKERDMDTKRTIDKYSEYQVELARLFKFSFINLQQFNGGLSSVERAKFKGVDLAPQQSDFRDTTNSFSDSDWVIGLMNPYKLDLDRCLDYDISKFRDRFIMAKVIKNRLSKDNLGIGLLTKFAAGSFIELPKASEINYTEYLKL